MADTHTDLTGAGSATAPYDTWAKAATDVQTGLTAAGAGGRAFVKDDSGATNPDTAASNRTLTSPGTTSNPAFLIGVKSTTTNEGSSIVDSDRCVRGTDSLPIFEATGAGSDITFAAAFDISGIRIVANDRLASGTSYVYARDCELSWNGFFFMSVIKSSFGGHNCDYIFGSISTAILPRAGTSFKMFGGLISGASPTFILDVIPAGAFEASGVDLGNAGSVLVDGGTAGTGSVIFRNCKVPTGVTLMTGAPYSNEYIAEMIGCSDATGISSGASVRDYTKETLAGTVEAELTAIRTGGSNDGASGGFSYAMTPNVDATLEASNCSSVISPWLTAWVEGDGTTAKTFTVFIANSGAADYNTDDVRLEILTPDDAGTTKHDYSIDGDIINGSTTAITDDAVSSWGTGGNNPQKLSVTITPDFEGPVYARIHFMKRFASSPETLYADGKLTVT